MAGRTHLNVDFRCGLRTHNGVINHHSVLTGKEWQPNEKFNAF